MIGIKKNCGQAWSQIPVEKICPNVKSVFFAEDLHLFCSFCA